MKSVWFTIYIESKHTMIVPYKFWEGGKCSNAFEFFEKVVKGTNWHKSTN